MKQSTIKKVIRRKINSWLETVDESIRHEVRNNIIITGGCITSMLLNEKVNDYDIYFKNKDTAWKIANMYVYRWNNNSQYKPYAKNPVVKMEARINAKGVEESRVIIYTQSDGVSGEEVISPMELNDLEMLVEDVKPQKERYRPVFFSENAITLSDEIQIIMRFQGTTYQLHENFDFAHCMCSYDFLSGFLDLPRDALEAMITRTLIYKGSLYPLASMFRTRKFIQRGWSITAGQMLKIAHQISNLNLNDREVLREQLIGVDMSYMEQLLYALREHEGAIDETYLARLIDEIFE